MAGGECLVSHSPRSRLEVILIMLLSSEGGFDFWKQLRPLGATCSSSREAWQSPAWIGVSGPGPERAGESGSFFLQVSLPEGRGTAPRAGFERGSIQSYFEDGVFVLCSHTQPTRVASNYLSLLHLIVTGTRGLFCARQWSKHFTKLTHLTLLIAYEVEPSIVCS